LQSLSELHACIVRGGVGLRDSYGSLVRLP
jgi:hypothetical protein